MRKFVFVFILFTSISIGIGAQSKNDWSNIEDYSSYNLSKSQQEQIRDINIEYSNKFKAVGNDRSLYGKEKGQKQRVLAEEKRNKIRAIVNTTSTEYTVEKSQSNANYKDVQTKYASREDALRSIDAQLKRLDAEYKVKQDGLKRIYRDKYEYKQRKAILNEEHKQRKERLKAEKKTIKQIYRR